jgi:hypothetical protein
MRRGAMRLERGLVTVDLDEKKQGRVVSFLMDVESVAAWFRVVAHPRVAQQAFAKSINDILTYAQMCGMEDWHGGHPLPVLHSEQLAAISRHQYSRTASLVGPLAVRRPHR